MIFRRLAISPECLGMMFTRPDGWKVVQNRLPEDARVVGVCLRGFGGLPTGTTFGPRFGEPTEIELLIESAVFRDDDPEDLPAPQMVAIQTP